MHRHSCSDFPSRVSPPPLPPLFRTEVPRTTCPRSARPGGRTGAERRLSWFCFFFFFFLQAPFDHGGQERLTSPCQRFRTVDIMSSEVFLDGSTQEFPPPLFPPGTYVLWDEDCTPDTLPVLEHPSFQGFLPLRCRPSNPLFCRIPLYF